MSTTQAKRRTIEANDSLACDPRWQLVERILTMPDFERSPRLSEFLRHVCRLSLENRSGEISEQSIGEDIFGRPQGYDSGADSIVRSNALRLRHRLEFYFTHEGTDEPVHIEIPRGGYVPRFFHPQHPPAEDLDKPQAGPQNVVLKTELPSLQPTGGVAQRWIAGFAAGLLLSACATAVLLHLHQDSLLAASQPISRQTPIQHRFWSQLFPEHGRSIVIPGDSGLVMFETATGQFLSLTDYLNGASYRWPANNLLPSGGPMLSAGDVGSRRYTSIVDLDLTSRLARLPEWNPDQDTIVFARDVRPEDASSSNLIILGSQQANPWISLVEPAMNFVLQPGKEQSFYFVNRHPQGSEQRQYRPSQAPGAMGADQVYGDIAYLPNPSGRGMVLVLSGLWMSGTQSAGNFVLDSQQFSSLLESVANRDGSIPPFEILLATKNLQGSSTSPLILAKRVYGHAQ